jgi:hypothetical protein
MKTMKMPKPMPALNIPPTTLQEVSNIKRKLNKGQKPRLDFFMIFNFIQLNIEINMPYFVAFALYCFL